MTSTSTPAPMPQAPPPGLTVGGYELRTRLGEGGMGVVHLGQRPGERPVALKVLRPHIVGDTEARQRLAREVGSLERIRSRRVAEIVDADPWGEIPYVATRYVPGLSLHDHVHAEGALADDDLVWFAECLAEALAAVHSVGVVHRDIKPSNIIMEGRSPVLIDFGLARVADDPRLTMTGWLLGTPGYLAPEILYGEDATAASDVHAWAATVAYAGLGRAPFGRGPSVAVMDRVRRGEYDLEGLDPRIRSLVEHALAPDPRDRPSLSEIREWLAHLSGSTPAPTPSAPSVIRGPVTMPLVAADQHQRAASTWFDDGPQRLAPDEDPPGETWHLAPEETEFVSAEYHSGAHASLGQRLRSGALVLAVGLALAGAVVAAPYVTAVTVLLLVWVLRSGSLAAAAARRRRELRGSRWYDPVLALVSAPWHLVAGVGGTLLLAAWSLGLGLATALLCFAVAASVTTSLGVVGFTVLASMWVGPGSTQLRGPVRRMVRPAGRRLVPWGLTVLLVLALAAGLIALGTSSGPWWAPATQSPFSGLEAPSWL